jgi:hypothetical protein
MPLSPETESLLHDLAKRPANHDNVKASFKELLVREFGMERGSLDFEVRAPVIAGRLDALVGRTVFEAKRDLNGEWRDVQRRMPDYLADREREFGEPFLGVASDGLRWVALELRDGELVRLTETVLDPDKGEAFLAWLNGVLALKSSLPPNSITIRAELGQESVAFSQVDRELRAAWERLKRDPAQALKRQLWADLLRLVYGRDVQGDSLWFQHTYLVIVAKCIALAVMDLREDDPARMLSGEAFTAAGIHGAVESDFFDWVIADAAGESLVRRIMEHVRRFRLREVESDVLKILYESLIDRDERHGLGEYYTPDWLAAKVVRHAVTDPVNQKVLDPACGSGAFLFHAVRLVLAEAEEAGMASAVRAAEACTLVQGTDIHPVAVIIARVTYLLALAPALGQRSGPLSVPVYLGDAMQLSVGTMGREKELTIQVPPPPAGGGSKEKLSFPETYCRDPALFNKAIEAMRAGSLSGHSREQVETEIGRQTEQHYKREINDEERIAIGDLGLTYATFHRLRLDGRDTIWVYVARNLSRPLALASGGGWANVLVGNPPWVAFRHMSADLQKRFRVLAEGEEVFVGGKFATQNDLSALFTVRAAHLYLRPAGRIAFVLPLASMTRGQFAKFRSGRFTSTNIAWDEAWTMDDRVTPLFPVPSCVVFGRKRATGKAMPGKVRAYSGSLPMRDAPEEIADRRLKVQEDTDAPQQGEFTGGSAYREAFRQGAILVPRMLCMVERRKLGRIGPTLDFPAIESRRSSQEKEPWRTVPSVSGQIEQRFLRPVLLGESILPYRLLQTFECAIPFDEIHGLITAAKARALIEDPAVTKSYTAIAEWLRTVETTWEEHRSPSTRLTLAEQLDFYGKLSAQFPVRPLRVVFAASGSLPTAVVLRSDRAVVEHGVYWSAPTTEEEAHYLAAVLNSEVARSRAERYQARGQFGARHFDKVIFNLPIPLFSAADPLHRDLAQAGAKAEEIAGMVELIPSERFQRARKRVRDALIEEGIGGEIEKLVEKLLDG